MSSEFKKDALLAAFGPYYYIPYVSDKIIYDSVHDIKRIYIEWLPVLHKSYFRVAHGPIMTILLCVGRSKLLNDIMLLEILPQVFTVSLYLCRHQLFPMISSAPTSMNEAIALRDRRLCVDVVVAGKSLIRCENVKNLDYYCRWVIRKDIVNVKYHVFCGWDELSEIDDHKPNEEIIIPITTDLLKKEDIVVLTGNVFKGINSFNSWGNSISTYT